MVSGNVWIDTGHGFGDPGALAADGTQESELVRILAQMLIKPLSAAGVSIGMSNTDCPLEMRGERAKGYGVFISLHLNSSLDKGDGVQGTECFALSNSLHVPTPSSLKLAEMMSAAVAKALGTRDRGAKTDNLAVLRGAQAVNVPTAVLLESYFLTDLTRQECLPLIQAAAPTIAQTLIAWFKTPR